jgi:hypothetical protein
MRMPGDVILTEPVLDQEGEREAVKTGFSLPRE